jgi:hypothetical protein
MEHIGNFRMFKNKTPNKKKPFEVGWGGEGGWGDICVR